MNYSLTDVFLFFWVAVILWIFVEYLYHRLAGKNNSEESERESSNNKTSIIK